MGIHKRLVQMCGAAYEKWDGRETKGQTQCPQPEVSPAPEWAGPAPDSTSETRSLLRPGPRKRTVQGDAVVLLHGFQGICLPLKVHVSCS